MSSESKEVTVVDENLTEDQQLQLAEMKNDIITRMQELSEFDRFRAQMAFHNELNRKPAFVVKERNGDSIPISYVEQMLDAYFLGSWSISNFNYKVVVNEIVGQIDLKVIHPVTGEPIIRSGAAAIQIMVNKDSDFTDVANKKRNALETGFPKLKAMCLKNAAKSLGKRFGRDLNRKHQSESLSIVKTTDDVLDSIINQNNEHED